MAVAREAPPIPWRFIVTLFAVAIVVGIAIAYLGITGQIGGPIP